MESLGRPRGKAVYAKNTHLFLAKDKQVPTNCEESSVTSKKLPNVHNCCPKMISLEK